MFSTLAIIQYQKETMSLIYETPTLLGSNVSQCLTRVVSNTRAHVSDTTLTHNYTELCDFFQIINGIDVSMSISGLRKS